MKTIASHLHAFRQFLLPLFVLASPTFMTGCATMDTRGAVQVGSPFAPAEIQTDMALVYFYKPLGYGMGKFPVFVDEKCITTLRKGGYYPCYVRPGAVRVTLVEIKKTMPKYGAAALSSGVIGVALLAAWPGSYSVTISAAPGGTYYFREKPGASVGLEQVDAGQALPDLQRCRHLQPHLAKE